MERRGRGSHTPNPLEEFCRDPGERGDSLLPTNALENNRLRDGSSGTTALAPSVPLIPDALSLYRDETHRDSHRLGPRHGQSWPCSKEKGRAQPE